jgi:shikimate kinase
MKVILIGYRGCGKTSVGKRIAQAKKLAYVDVDDVTCQHIGCDSIAKIWADHGEPYWRENEVAVTQQLCSQDNLVIGLGGGTLMQDGARQAIEAATDTIRIYLKASPEVLYQRITGDIRSSETRPSLTAMGGGLDEVIHMLEKREPTYEAVADVVLQISDMDLDQVTAAVLKVC